MKFINTYKRVGSSVDGNDHLHLYIDIQRAILIPSLIRITSAGSKTGH